MPSNPFNPSVQSEPLITLKKKLEWLHTDICVHTIIVTTLHSMQHKPFKFLVESSTHCEVTIESVQVYGLDHIYSNVITINASRIIELSILLCRRIDHNPLPNSLMCEQCLQKRQYNLCPWWRQCNPSPLFLHKILCLDLFIYVSLHIGRLSYFSSQDYWWESYINNRKVNHEFLTLFVVLYYNGEVREINHGSQFLLCYPHYPKLIEITQCTLHDLKQAIQHKLN